jgi:hypothetical protein
MHPTHCSSCRRLREREREGSAAAVAMARLVDLAAAAVLLILLQLASANDIVLGRKGRLTTVDEPAEKENTASSAGSEVRRDLRRREHGQPGARLQVRPQDGPRQDRRRHRVLCTGTRTHTNSS